MQTLENKPARGGAAAHVTADAGTASAGYGDIVSLGAGALSLAIRQRDVSCREVMQAYLAHIDHINPSVNAIVALQDGDRLMAQADGCDHLLDQGEYLGWMHGMPQAIKDLSDTVGIRTTYGSPLFKDHVPLKDSIMVERMKRAGAIVIGKTNTPEFGMGSQTYNPVYGTTLNAYDPTKVAGGSSGGAAVALALRMLPVADGSDMMGSLRNPAAFNNVFGFRPSQGRVPSGPDKELFVSQLGCEGPMARSVKDLALLFGTQAGHDMRAPLSTAQPPADYATQLERDVKGCKIGWLGNYNGYLPMEPGVMALCESALTDFKALGCDVEAATPAFALSDLWKTWMVHRQWLVAGGLRAAYADPVQRAQLKPEATWEIEGGLRLNALEVYEASAQRSAWYRAMLALFERFDYLLLPTAQVFPFDAAIHWPSQVAGRDMNTYHRWMEVVIGPTLAGLPALNVPAGFNDAGLPTGLQIIGRPGADLAVLQLGHAYEQATQWVQRRAPALLA